MVQATHTQQAEETLNRIEREDITNFLASCMAATRQDEFYSSELAHHVSLAFLHDYMLVNYRDLYARALTAGINLLNQRMIIVNLLRWSRGISPERRVLEGRLIARALDQMPAPQAYRTLRELVRRRITSRRVRAIIRDFVTGRPNLPLHVLKYRPALKAIVKHAHVRLDEESQLILFHPLSKWGKLKTPLYETFRKAHYNKSMIYELPMTVAEGLASRHRIPRRIFLERIQDHMTAREKQRAQRSARAVGVDLSVNLQRMSLTRLSLYVASMSNEELDATTPQLDRAMAAAAARASSKIARRYGRVALVLDSSYSSSSSRAKKNRPLAIAMGAVALFRAISESVSVHWTHAPGRSNVNPWRVRPRGQSNLARPLLDALATSPDHVIVVSDGYENDPCGGVDQVLKIWQERFGRGAKIEFVQINPVFDPTTYSTKALSERLPVFGVRDVEDIPLACALARFAAGVVDMKYLIRLLDARAEAA